MVKLRRQCSDGLCRAPINQQRLWYHRNAINTLRPRQNGRRFADDTLKCIFLNENTWISLKISLKFVPKVQINNIPALVQILAWCRSGDKPLSEPMMVSLLTHICVARPQGVNTFRTEQNGQLDRHFGMHVLQWNMWTLDNFSLQYG